MWRKKKTSEPDRSVVATLMGDTYAGKTQFINVIENDCSHFSPCEKSTLGASFSLKVFQYQGHTIKFTFWDTSGHERCIPMYPMYYNTSPIIILAYNLANRSTLEFLEKLSTLSFGDATVFLVGTHLDVAETQIQRNPENNPCSGRDYSADWNIYK